MTLQPTALTHTQMTPGLAGASPGSLGALSTATIDTGLRPGVSALSHAAPCARRGTCGRGGGLTGKRISAPPPLLALPYTADTGQEAEARRARNIARNRAAEAELIDQLAADPTAAARAAAREAELADANHQINISIDPKFLIGEDAIGRGSHCMQGVLRAFGTNCRCISMPLAADCMSELHNMLVQGARLNLLIRRSAVMGCAIACRELLALAHDKAFGIGAPPYDYRHCWASHYEPSPGASDDELFDLFLK